MAEIDTKKVLFEALKQTPVIALLALALFGNFKGIWIWGSAHQIAVATVQGNLDRCEAEKAQVTEIVVKGIQFGQRRARETTDKIDSESSTARPDVKLTVRPKPVSDREKSAALSPVTNTDPKTLAQKQDAVQNLVNKTAPTGDAKVVKEREKP